MKIDKEFLAKVLRINADKINRILEKHNYPELFSTDDEILNEKIFNALNIKNQFWDYKEFLLFINMLNTETETKQKTKQIYKTLQETLKENIENVWMQNTQTIYHIHIGATNSGKTYNAIQALIKSENGIYLSPLRLLAFEVQEKIKSYGYDCSLITGEEKVEVEGARYSSRTVELNDYAKEYDCAVIDECFMLSDVHRGRHWLKAIIETKAKEIHLISSLESVELIKTILKRLNRPFKEYNYERKVPLILKNTLKLKDIPSKTILVTFSRINVLIQKTLLEEKGYKVSVLYGNLPPEIKKQQMQQFINGETDIVVSTDVIGMGLNLPCDNICFLQVDKYDGSQTRPLNPTEVKQISGRAGRFGLSQQGNIYALDSKQIKHIKYCLESEIKSLDKTYCSVDFNTLRQLPEKTLKDKIKRYSELKFVPNVLKDIIQLEDVSPYINTITECPLLEKLDIETSWKLLMLPIKESCRYYFNYLVECVLKNKKVENNFNLKISTIKDNTELKQYEDYVAKIELLLYFANTSAFRQYVDNQLYYTVIELRNIIIDNITNFLLDKELSKYKKCKSCDAKIHISSSNSYCDDCYDSKY